MNKNLNKTIGLEENKAQANAIKDKLANLWWQLNVVLQVMQKQNKKQNNNNNNKKNWKQKQHAGNCRTYS